MKTRYSIALLMVASLALCACGGRDKKIGATQEVNAAIATMGSIERKVLFTGSIEAEDAVDVYPKASGKVAQKLLKEGDPVKKGQAIVLLDRDEVGYSFKSSPVESPIDGFVGKIPVDVGSYVYDRAAGKQSPVATVVRPGNMRVKIDVPERYLQAISLGTEVTMYVDSLGEEIFKGTIISKSPFVDEKTRTAKIEVLVPNPDLKLRHGMFNRMFLDVERRDNVLTVPLGSISWEGAKHYVYKIQDGKVSHAEVKTGLRNDTHIEILEGLNEGDQVAAGKLLELKDGEEVKVVDN